MIFCDKTPNLFYRRFNAYIIPFSGTNVNRKWLFYIKHFHHLPSVVISSHSPISLTAAIAQSSTATMIAVRIVFPIFITSLVYCDLVTALNFLDSCDSAVKYSYNDSRKDRLSHFYHLPSFVLYTLYHLIIVNKSVIFKNFFVYVFAHL